MTRRTRSDVSGETSGRLFRTRDTVWVETPAAAAMSRIVRRFAGATVRFLLTASAATVPPALEIA
jgi:hypothetical protein